MKCDPLQTALRDNNKQPSSQIVHIAKITEPEVVDINEEFEKVAKDSENSDFWGGCEELDGVVRVREEEIDEVCDLETPGIASMRNSEDFGMEPASLEHPSELIDDSMSSMINFHVKLKIYLL